MIDPLTQTPITRRMIHTDLGKTMRCIRNPHNLPIVLALLRRIIRLVLDWRKAAA